MDHNWFRLETPPFDDRADGRLFHSTPDRERILEQLMQHAQFGKGMALLTADAGLGKTMLLRTLLLRLHTTDHAAMLSWPPDSDRDVIRETCKRFSVGLPFSKDRARTAKRLRTHLQKMWEVGHRSLLIIDQAENLSANHLSQLAEFMAGSTEESESIRVVLCGRPMLSRVLERTEFTQFRQQITVTNTLRPMTLDETRDYFRTRLIAAGHSAGDLFENEAIQLIHAASGGVPRSVNAAALRAMQAARFAGEKRIRAVRIIATSQMSTTVSAPLESIRPAAIASAERASKESFGVLGVTDPYTSAKEREVVMTASSGVLGGANVSREVQAIGASIPGIIGEMAREMPVSEVTTAGTIRTAPDSVTTAANIQRLEQLLARAEQSAATLDMSVRDSVGAGERLSFVRDRADRLTQELNQSNEQAEQTLSHVKRRSEEIIDETDRRVSDVRGQIGQVFETLAESDPIRRIQQACSRADEIEARLNSFSDQVAQRAEEQLARMGALAEKIDRADIAQQRLESVLGRIDSMQSAFDSTMKTMQTRMEEVISSTDRMQKKFIDNVSETEKRSAEIGRQLSEASLHAVVEVENAQRSLATVREQAANEIEELRGELKNAERKKTSIEQELTNRLAQQNSEAKQHADEWSARIRQLRELASATEDEMLDTVEQTKSEFATMAAELKRSFVAQLEDRTTESAKQLEEMTAKVSELQEITTAARAKATEEVSDMRRLFAELAGERTERIDDLQHYMNALDGRYTQLQFRVGEIGQEFTGMETKINQWETKLTGPQKLMETWIERAESVIGELSSSVRRADDLQNGTKESVGRLESLRHAVASTLVDLGAAYERVKPLTDRVAEAEGVATSLRAATDEARSTNKQVGELVATSKQWQETVRQVCALTEEKSRQLDSHNAAATQTLRQLSEATMSGQKVLNRANEITKESESLAATTRDQIEKMTQEIWSLSTTAETRANELNTAGTRSMEVIQRITELAAQRDTILGTLTEQVKAAQESVQSIQEHTSQSALLAERLSAVTPLIRMAQETGDVIRKALDDATRVHTDIVTATGLGSEQCTELHNVTGTAQSLIETQQQVLRRVEEAVGELNERLDEGRGTVEALEHLRREFTTQAEGVHTKLDEMRRQAADVEGKVMTIITKPQEIIATAQNQAAQLERVCGVVRKVFAGLSQASLDAVQKTKEFKEVSEAAVDRVARLQGETDRASATLHEWVAEAVRVQSRLEKLVQQAPSISATHPSDALHGIAQRLQTNTVVEIPRSIDAPIGTQASGLRTLVTPKTTQPVSAPTKSVTPSATKTPNDRISAMIEEAKEAAIAKT